MITNAPNQPPQHVGAWLLEDADPTTVERALQQPSRHRGTPLTGQLGRAARASLARQVVAKLQEVFGHSLSEVVTAGWDKSAELIRAAAETAGHPQEEKTVELAERRITSLYEPTVKVFIDKDPTPVFTVNGEIEIVFDLGHADGVVRGGRFVEIQAGHSAVTGSVKIEGQLLASKTINSPYGLVLTFGSGIDLTHPVLTWAAGVEQFDRSDRVSQPAESSTESAYQSPSSGRLPIQRQADTRRSDFAEPG